MANALLFAPLTIVGASASNTAAGRSPIYVGNDHAGVVWESNGEAAPWLVLDLGADVSLDTLALFGLSGFTVAQNATVLVATAAQGSGFAGGAYTTFAAGPVLAGANLPVNGKGVGLFTAAAAVTARYVKIVFAGLSGSVQVAIAAPGKKLPLDRNFAFGGGPGVRDLGKVDFSARGVLIRFRGKKMRTYVVTYSHINKDEVEAFTKRLVEQVGNTEKVVLITDPSPHAYRQDRSYVGFLVGDLGHVQRNARAWETKFSMVSIF